MSKWVTKLLSKMGRLLPLRFMYDVRAAIANQVAGILVALFMMGSIGATAVVMSSNATLFAGAPTTVILVYTVGIPMFAAVAIMLYFLPKRS